MIPVCTGRQQGRNSASLREEMTLINSVPIEIIVVLGRATMPINQLLKMGRGAVIEIGANDGDEVEILADNTLVATG